MENHTAKPWPAYAKFSIILTGIVSLCAILYVGRDIIVPFLFATVIAILLNPVVNFLHRKKMNRILAIALSVLGTLVITIGLLYFIVSQASMLSDSFPQFKIRFNQITSELVDWVSANMNIPKDKILAWVKDTQKKVSGNLAPMISSAFLTIGGVLALILLLPVYIFMILFYKPLLLEFLSRLATTGRHKVMIDILEQTKALVQSYLAGLLIEAAIVATLNSVALLMLGIQYAILLGIVGALLNMIPYIGGIIAISMPMLMAVATKEPIYALWVFGAYLLVQFIDNNFIVPKIVASKVQVNALVSIIVVLIGGALWGVAGMFLSLPLTAILKVIFDRVPDLAPFGYLIGDDQPEVKRPVIKNNKAVKK
ncbi:MAG TPA: AI-2E family transporter [Cytophagaceae bacterium]|nr:AI-2E family transporter [Cytophagaceae bacterium]